MLNEQEREDGPEEGEYHFSDEGGYKPTMEEEEAKPPTVTEGGGLAAKFSSYRRFVIGVAIFAGLLLVVYLIIPPLTTPAPSTDIAAVSSPSAASVETPAEPSASPAVTSAAPHATPPAALASAATSKEASVAPVGDAQPSKSFFAAEKEKLATEKNKVMAHLGSHSQESSSLTLPSEQLTAPGNPPPAQPGNLQSAPAPATEMASSSPLVSPMAQELISSPTGVVAGQEAVRQAVENKAVLDRLTAIAEANTKLIGQLHAEYSQKLAAYDAQDKVLQEQVRTLNGRLISMEAEMSKLVQALNNKQQAPAAANESASSGNEGGNTNLTLSGSSAAAAVPVAPMQASEKASYTVQAIIPGRAWLRSDGGETITVAEGDLLKNLGRVTKIDPYDGTIQVDTGSKMVTLTYGNGDYA